MSQGPYPPNYQQPVPQQGFAPYSDNSSSATSNMNVEIKNNAAAGLGIAVICLFVNIIIVVSVMYVYVTKLALIYDIITGNSTAGIDETTSSSGKSGLLF